VWISCCGHGCPSSTRGSRCCAGCSLGLRTLHCGTQEVDNTAYDQWLEQLSEDTKQYVRAVFKTLVATVPKAIIHSQARSSTSNEAQ